MSPREDSLEALITTRSQRQLTVTANALAAELRRSIVALDGIRDVLKQDGGAYPVPADILVELSRRVDAARDLADLLELSGVRAGHAAENTRVERLRP